MNPLCFFTHVALATDTRSLSRPQATANLLIELDDRTLRSGDEERHLKFSTLTDVEKVDLAKEITGYSHEETPEITFDNFVKPTFFQRVFGR